MAFLVLIDDHPDSEARRRAHRQEHLNGQKPFVEDGSLILGGALLDADRRAIGSAAILNLDSASEVEEWFHNDTYYQHDVWKSIRIFPFRIAEPLFE